MQTQINNQHVLVGLDKTAMSCARYLRSQKIPFSAVDSREMPAGIDEFRAEFPDTSVELGELNAATLCAADTLVMSPEVDLRTPAVRKAIDNGVPVTGDIDMFAKVAKAPIVAITGSNHKSVVVILVGAMAKAQGIKVAVAGNTGLPVLDLLAESAYELFVLELSSFQLETTSNLGAKVATVLNMSPKHLDRYDSMQAYHKAKHRIFQGCKHAVINRDDALSRPLLPSAVQVTSFGTGKEQSREFSVITSDSKQWLAFAQQPLIAVEEVKIVGTQNIANALAALALGKAAGLAWEPMLEALRNSAELFSADFNADIVTPAVEELH
ncbi:MAG: Mur ligase family protein [Pseudomonadota bacterium]